VTRAQKIELMLWRARQLAALGYQPATIGTALVADGFSEAADLIADGNLHKELRQTAERARSAGRTGKKLFHSGRQV
jgi:hypothetical protein